MFSINRLYKGSGKDLEDWLSKTYASDTNSLSPVIPAASRTKMEELEVPHEVPGLCSELARGPEAAPMSQC